MPADAVNAAIESSVTASDRTWCCVMGGIVLFAGHTIHGKSRHVAVCQPYRRFRFGSVIGTDLFTDTDQGISFIFSQQQ